jgi:hypothetical protein
MEYNCPDCDKSKPCIECERLKEYLNGLVISVGTWVKPKTELVENDPCKNCPNNSANGGSGICCCSLPNLFNNRY